MTIPSQCPLCSLHVLRLNVQSCHFASGTEMQSFKCPACQSVPVLDEAIPTSSGNFTAFQWMPFSVNANTVMSLDGSEALGGLPVPEPASAFTITRDHVATIWREVRPARIASDGVALEGLLAVLSKAILGAAAHHNVSQDAASKLSPHAFTTPPPCRARRMLA